MKAEVYVGLGTNLGEREKNLNLAIGYLSKITDIEQVSSVYETEPWGYEQQPKFLNQVVELRVEQTPYQLLCDLKDIEEKIGREKSFHYGPRKIDLDILFYEDQILRTDTLTIPHPHISERAFVLVPMNEIAPEFFHPEHHKTIQQLVDLIDTSVVNLYRSEREI